MTLTKKIDWGLFGKKKTDQPGGGHVSGALKEVMSESAALGDVIKAVAPGAIVNWVSNGEWSMHQMLLALLDITGPARVYISSYAMSETAARVIAQLKNAGMAQKLYCVLDSRVDVRTAGSLQVIKAICDKVVLVDTHAKVTVLLNDQWSIAVVGSANYTTNKRWESGIISCNESIASMQVKWMKNELKDGKAA